MSQSHNSVISLLAIIVLLVLTVLATALYSGDKAQQNKLDHNVFWRTTRLVFNSTLGLLQGATEINTPQGNVSSPTNSDHSQNLESKKHFQNSTTWMSKTMEKIKKAWAESDQNNSPPSSSTNDQKIFDWQKLNNGAEIIFRPEKGSEYKLLLPFKFLGS